MFVLDVAACFGDAVLWENVALSWWHADEVRSLDLYQGFHRGWAVMHPPNQ
jgi:hypothetical protein